jgi:hypothetical protein
MSVLMSYRKGSIGAALRKHILEHAKRDGTISAVIAMTRCSRFESSLPPGPERLDEYRRYVSMKDDPTLFFHLSGGAEIIDVIEGFRPRDYENLGNAILISYVSPVSPILRTFVQSVYFDCRIIYFLSLRYENYLSAAYNTAKYFRSLGHEEISGYIRRARNGASIAYKR